MIELKPPFTKLSILNQLLIESFLTLGDSRLQKMKTISDFSRVSLSPLTFFLGYITTDFAIERLMKEILPRIEDE
jgi:hypothetical protein